MSIDILIKEYQKAIMELEKSEKTEYAKSEENKKRIRKRLSMVLSLLIPICGILISYYSEEVLFGIGFFAAMCVEYIFIIRWMIKNSLKWQINYSKKHEPKRISELKKLFKDYKLCICDSTIDLLIKECERNKSKYDNLKEVRLFFSYAISFLAGLFALVYKLTEVKMSVNAGATLIVYLGTFGMVAILVKLMLSSVLVPKINKLYYFHDTFIEDLNKLRIFKSLYSSDDFLNNSIET